MQTDHVQAEFGRHLIIARGNGAMLIVIRPRQRIKRGCAPQRCIRSLIPPAKSPGCPNPDRLRRLCSIQPRRGVRARQPANARGFFARGSDERLQR